MGCVSLQAHMFLLCMWTCRGGLLDGYGRETSCTHSRALSGGDLAARCSFLWQGISHWWSHWENVRGHHPHSRCHGRKSESYKLIKLIDKICHPLTRKKSLDLVTHFYFNCIHHHIHLILNGLFFYFHSNSCTLGGEIYSARLNIPGRVCGSLRERVEIDSNDASHDSTASCSGCTPDFNNH